MSRVCLVIRPCPAHNDSCVCGVAVMDDDARNHVKNCEQCRADITWLQWLVDFGSREGTYDPPSWAVSNAENVFRLKKPGLVTIAKETVANLIYDSFNEPLPFGVRQRDLPARQALYQTDHVHLDLKIEAGDEKGLIIGQIVADKADGHFAGPELRWIKLGLIADLRLQQVVARRRRFSDRRDVIVRKRM